MWPDGRVCPHCRGKRSWPIAGKAARVGLYECRGCRRQFTVTTGTPMHGTKLPLWRWIHVMWLMCWSSKGVSSVVMGRWTGLPQSTAWRVMQRCREMMNRYDHLPMALAGTVEVDDKRLGGAPRYKRGVKHKRGKGTSKPLVIIAQNRDGFVRAAHVRGDAVPDVNWFFHLYIDRSARLMSDSHSTFVKLGKQYASHEVVTHSKREYAQGDVHCNGAESFGSYLERALVGVYHFMSHRHLQRYVGEAVFRWNAKTFVESPEGDPTNVLVRMPPVFQVSRLVSRAHGIEMRRATTGGLRYPDEPDRTIPRRWKFWCRWAQRVGGDPYERLIRIVTGELPPPPEYHRSKRKRHWPGPPSWLPSSEKALFAGYAENRGRLTTYQ